MDSTLKTEPQRKKRSTEGSENDYSTGSQSKRRRNEEQEIKRTEEPGPKRRIFLNAFDMFTVGQMSFGQWRNPKDRTADKRRDLSYWTDLAKLLEKGDFNAIFLADTYGWCDVYKGDAEACVRTAIQYPMGDPAVPITAMATVTKNLGFAITSSTSFESPYVLAKRFSTLDHLTRGRFGWNVVTSWKASGFKAVSEIQRRPPEGPGTDKVNRRSVLNQSIMTSATKSRMSIFVFYISILHPVFCHFWAKR